MLVANNKNIIKNETPCLFIIIELLDPRMDLKVNKILQNINKFIMEISH